MNSNMSQDNEMRVAAELASVDVMQPTKPSTEHVRRLLLSYAQADPHDLASALEMVMHRDKLYYAAPLILEVCDRLRRK